MAVADVKSTPFSLDLRVEAAGPFKDAQEIGQIRPGVNLLRAPNGAGKTTLMRLLCAFAKKKLSVGDLTVNDEATDSVARVQFGGASMSARIGRVPARDGEESLPPIEGLPDPIRSLETGDHRKSDGAQFRARLAALLRWVGIEAIDELRAELAGDDPKLRSWARSQGVQYDDLIEYTTKLRSFAHACRREREEELEKQQLEYANLEGKRDQILETAGVSLEDVAAAQDEDEVRRTLSAARDVAVTKRARRQSGLEEAERREKVRGSLGDRPSTEAAEAAVEDAGAALTEAEAEVERVAAEVSELRERLAAREQALMGARTDVVSRRAAAEEAADRLRSVRVDQERHDDLVRSLEEPLTFPTLEEVEQAESEVERQSAELRSVEIAGKVQSANAALQKRQELIAAEQDAVSHYETQAAEVWNRLADIVNRELDSERIRVRDEAIEIEVDGRWFDIADPERVSEGQRTDACYDLLLQHRHGQLVIVIEGATTVDPQRLGRLGAKAHERGIALVMESPDAEAGAFELEHFGAEEVA